MSHPIDGVAQLTVTGSVGPTNGKFWNAVDVTSAVSQVFKVFFADSFSCQVEWTGNTTGATKLEMCLDYREDEHGNVTQAGNWTDITANALTKYPFVTKYGTDPAGATGGPVMYAVQQLPACFLRLTYTPTGGAATRTMDGYYHSKGL